MTESEIQSAIFDGLRKIAPETDPQQLKPTENLREALDIDSFDFLNFLIGLHERLGVEIPEADYGRLTTLSALVQYLSKKLPGGPTEAS
ncbi:MAG: acyl carrier protein [Acidobacteriia bacterium]|nr:acyl carrier protein [Terriglobia bacterium]